MGAIADLPLFEQSSSAVVVLRASCTIIFDYALAFWNVLEC